MDSKIFKIGIAAFLFILLTKYCILALIVFYVWNYVEINKISPTSEDKFQLAYTSTIDKIKLFFLN